MRPRYIKVFRDLTKDLSKNLMLVLALAIGIFGIGSILGGYAVISREMTSNYMITVPASATLEIDGDITPALLDSVRALPGIQNAERRTTVVGRMKVNDQWHPILFFVIDDFAKMTISKFRPVSELQIPPTGSMLVERTALMVMNAKDGDMITVHTPIGQVQSLRISGIVHDPALAPAWQEQAGYAYVTMETLKGLGENARFDLLRIQVEPQNEFSRDAITQQAEVVADWLKSKGFEIHEIQVPPPGRHPHQSQMEAVLSIFTVFTFMILVLGSMLVASSMATLMLKQVRQIGVMKTIGGTSYKVSLMYLLMMLIVSIAALLVSIPLSRLAASGFYTQIANLLNLEIFDSSIPIRVPLIQIAVGILIPMLTAAFPLIRGSRISVRTALDNHGVSVQNESPVSILSRIDVFRDIYKLSLRNVFRHRTRLILTLGLLAAGGSMFMTALNVSDAWDINLRRIYTQRLYDQEIKLNQRQVLDSLIIQTKKIEGIKKVEGWEIMSTSIINNSKYELTKTYPDKGHGSFNIQAIPLPTTLLNPSLTEGRWLLPEDTNEVVLNQLARTQEMKIGDDVTLAVDGKPARWKIVGFTEDVGSPATAYVSLKMFSKIVESDGKISTLRIAYTDRSQNNALIKSRQIDELFEAQQISVNSSTPVWLLHNAVAAHMKVLVNALLTMAILMAVVGTLGLTSTISMSVLERTREIGVMRAIGARPSKITKLIVWEGLTIGIMSIAVAFAFSLILSYFMGQFIGNISFRTPLALTISLRAIGIWIVLVGTGSYLAAIFPARRANQVTTREALAYE